MSGQVAVIILDSIKRNITKEYRWSVKQGAAASRYCQEASERTVANSLEAAGIVCGDTHTVQKLSRALLIKAELLPLAEKHF